MGTKISVDIALMMNKGLELRPLNMGTPITHALAWLDRMTVALLQLDLMTLRDLKFFAPDADRFPALRLAWLALQAGEEATTILNAANKTTGRLFTSGLIEKGPGHRTAPWPSSDRLTKHDHSAPCK